MAATVDSKQNIIDKLTTNVNNIFMALAASSNRIQESKKTAAEKLTTAAGQSLVEAATSNVPSQLASDIPQARLIIATGQVLLTTMGIEKLVDLVLSHHDKWVKVDQKEIKFLGETTSLLSESIDYEWIGKLGIQKSMIDDMIKYITDMTIGNKDNVDFGFNNKEKETIFAFASGIIKLALKYLLLDLEPEKIAYDSATGEKIWITKQENKYKFDLSKELIKRQVVGIPFAG